MIAANIQWLRVSRRTGIMAMLAWKNDGIRGCTSSGSRRRGQNQDWKKYGRSRSGVPSSSNAQILRKEVCELVKIRSPKQHAYPHAHRTFSLLTGSSSASAASLSALVIFARSPLDNIAIHLRKKNVRSLVCSQFR